MKNRAYIQSINKIEPDQAARERMLRQILDRTESRPATTRKVNDMNKTVKRLIPVMATCLALMVAGAAILPRIYGSGRLPLPKSSGNASVRYIKNPPMIKTSQSLISLTEDEIFSDEWASAIFYGRVTEIRNIVLNFNFSLDYRAIAKIKVEEAYKGDIAVGDVISVLLNCPIASGVWVTDTEVTSQLREGMTGIFMPRRFSETDYWEQNGAKLLIRDVAPYILNERFAFLETPGGLAYAEWAFPSLPKNATLQDVKALIGNPKTHTLQKLVINEVPEIHMTRSNLALLPDDFVSMSKQEIVDFYGFDFFPKSIPSDMTEAPETAFGLYKRNGGTGEVYHSANLAWYINADFSREIQVEIDKGQLPLTDIAFLGGEHEKSNINGVDMVIKRWVDSAGEVRFVAEMMFQGNGLRVSSRGFTQAEFIDTVSSLLV